MAGFGVHDAGIDGAYPHARGPSSARRTLAPLAPQRADDLLLIAYHAEPSSPSAAALALLGSVAVTA